MNLLKLHFKSEYYPVTVEEVLVSAGQKLKGDEKLFKYEYDRPIKKTDGDHFGRVIKTTYKKTKDFFKVNKGGTIEEILVKKGDIINGPDQVVISLKVSCAHTIVIYGLCADCGIDILDFNDTFTNDSYVPISHNTNEIMISSERAKYDSDTQMERLLMEKKLILVLDLDQTVIQANTKPTIGEYMKDPSNPNYEAVKDIKTFRLAPPDPNTYYIKLRPGLNQFLEGLYEKYEMHVYTMGTRSYAEEVCKIIDPTKKYFSDRIISRTESGSDKKKSLKRLFPSDNSMVVIVDDRYDVWDWVPNLVRIWPYDFFGNGDINGAQFKQLEVKATIDNENNNVPIIIEPNEENSSNKGTTDAHPVLIDDDDHLKYTLDVILKIHFEFYEFYDDYIDEALELLKSNVKSPMLPNVSDILTALRYDVLCNSNILFTGFFPLEDSQQKRDTLKLAEFYGAKCHNKFSNEITHLIAKQPNTEKVKLAKEKNSMFILKIEWLYESIKRWKRVDELPYCFYVPPRNRFLPEMNRLINDLNTNTPSPSREESLLQNLEPIYDGYCNRKYGDVDDDQIEDSDEEVEEQSQGPISEPLVDYSDPFAEKEKFLELNEEDLQILNGLSGEDDDEYDLFGLRRDDKSEVNNNSVSHGIKRDRSPINSLSVRRGKKVHNDLGNKFDLEDTINDFEDIDVNEEGLSQEQEDSEGINDTNSKYEEEEEDDDEYDELLNELDEYVSEDESKLNNDSLEGEEMKESNGLRDPESTNNEDNSMHKKEKETLNGAETKDGEGESHPLNGTGSKSELPNLGRNGKETLQM